MAEKRIELHEAGVRVLDLDVPRKDVADFLRSVPEETREMVFIQAVEVGVFCLERARTTQDTDFVRRQVEALINRVEAAVGTIPGETEKSLLAKIGTNEGQVLAPISNLVNEVTRGLNERLKEVRDLLSQELDPAKETTTVGRVLRNLRDLLDPKRTDSVQGTVEAALKNVTGEDGILAKAVKAVVTDAIRPLKEDVDSLAKEIRGQEAATEALEQTTEKGAPYEEDAVTRIQEWAHHAGVEVYHVGADNRPGDILVRVPPGSLVPTAIAMVVEVRDRQSPMGRKAVSDALSTAMAERQANAGVYLSRTREGLGKEIGDWAEGEVERGPFVACTHPHLITALRFLIVQQRLATLRAAAPEVDSASIESQLQRIRTSLDRVKTINRKVTDVHGSANEIQAEAEQMRDEIRGALTSIEDALRNAAGKGRVADSVSS